MSGTLYHAPAEIIAKLIDDLGLGNIEDTNEAAPVTGWTIFSVSIPESPEQAIVVKDTYGRQFGRSHPTGTKPEHYGIQVLVRASSAPVVPYKRCKLIMEYFDTQVRRDEVKLYDSDTETYRVYRVNAITRVSTVAPAGNDGRRFFFVGNALASIEYVRNDTTGTGS